MPTLEDITIGVTLSFQSKAPNDNNKYYGQVIAMSTYELASKYGDLHAYNSAVQAIDTLVPDISMLQFAMIKLYETLPNQPSKYVIPFALDWINLPTLEIIAVDRVAIIRVYEVDSTNVQDVLNLLKSNGFKARVDELK